MSLSVLTVYELNASATASNANGGGFNPSNANMLTDLAATSATGNAAVVTSATYTFVAGDVGHWVYVKSGTNWTAGWYKIASVAAGAATLNSAIGAAIQTDSTQGSPSPRYKTNTVAGVATVASPTAGTFTIDYSQSTTAIKTDTNLTCTAASTTIVATTGFTPVMVGNLIHLTILTGTGAIVGWYEIVSYTNGTTVVLDRTPTDGVNNITAGTFYVGGAISLNSTLDDDFFEIMSGTNGTGANRIFVKNGSYSLGEAVAIASAGGTQAPVIIEGYNTTRGDIPTGTSRPEITGGASALTLAANWEMYNVSFNSSATTGFTMGAGNKIVNTKIVNNSTLVRVAMIPGADTFILNSEIISYKGTAVSISASIVQIVGSYIHNSNNGITMGSSASNLHLLNSIISSNVAQAINTTAAPVGNLLIVGNTFYGAENKLGVGMNWITGTTDVHTLNNIFYGFTTAVTHANVQTVSFDNYNNYFNNTADVNNWAKGANTLAVNPAFTSMSQMTGTGATSLTNVLTHAAGGFNATVTDNVTLVYLVSGTGTGFIAGNYLVTAHTDTTLTLSSVITSSGAGSAIVFQLDYGLNFLPTGSI